MCFVPAAPAWSPQGTVVACVRRADTVPHWLVGCRGKKRAAIAASHTLLVIICRMLKEGATNRQINGESKAA